MSSIPQNQPQPQPAETYVKYVWRTMGWRCVHCGATPALVEHLGHTMMARSSGGLFVPYCSRCCVEAVELHVITRKQIAELGGAS